MLSGFWRKWAVTIFLAGAALLYAEHALSEAAEGVVRLVGSAASAVTVLTDAEDKQTANLCSNDQSKLIGRLTGMSVKVDGAWSEPIKGAVRCFKATSFTVLKVSSGRDALVGTLNPVEDGFEVVTESGEKRFLLRVPKGLRKLSGQRVIIDVKPMSSPTMKREAWKVVTFAPYPN